MITDARQIASDTDIQGNIAIIGAGAAGITLAVELAKQFRDVLVLESGSLLFEQKTQNLYEGPVLGRDDMDLAGCRLRYFGGSTNHWNGVCAPMDAVNFERVPGRPHSGWPFKLDELVPFYERAYSLCEIGVYQKTPPVLGGAEPKARQILDNREFQIAEFRHSPPTRFGKRYRSDLASSDRIKVYLHANVTNISVSNNGKAISSLDVQTLAFQSAASPGVEIEGDGATSGITQAMIFISEPAPRAPKSSSMTPPFSPATATWARKPWSRQSDGDALPAT